jgi:hypothetical protein
MVLYLAPEELCTLVDDSTVTRRDTPASEGQGFAGLSAEFAACLQSCRYDCDLSSQLNSFQAHASSFAGLSYPGANSAPSPQALPSTEVHQLRCRHVCAHCPGCHGVPGRMTHNAAA